MCGRRRIPVLLAGCGQSGLSRVKRVMWLWSELVQQVWQLRIVLPKVACGSQWSTRIQILGAKSGAVKGKSRLRKKRPHGLRKFAVSISNFSPAQVSFNSLKDENSSRKRQAAFAS